MLREMAEGLEALTKEHPVIVWLDDLHWSDPSTLDLLAFLAKRQEPARLLVIGTYRPVDAIVSQHPLRSVQRELQLHGQCEELILDYLSETDIQAYLADRYGQTVLSQRLAGLIHQRTDGNPCSWSASLMAWPEQGCWQTAGRSSHSRISRRP